MEMQIQRTIEYLRTLPVSLAIIENIEADDSIAYISKQLLTDSQISIMSTDRDFLQLVNDRISVWSPTKKILYTPKLVLRDYEIPAHNYLLYRILEGDTTDNIPGVRLVGLSTVKKRFPNILSDSKFTVDQLLVEAEKGELKVHESICNSKDIINRNYKLMQLEDVDISATAKSKLRNIVNGKIPTLNKFQFEQMFLTDQLYQTIPNIETWLAQSFSALDKYVKEHNG